MCDPQKCKKMKSPLGSWELGGTDSFERKSRENMKTRNVATRFYCICFLTFPSSILRGKMSRTLLRKEYPYNQPFPFDQSLWYIIIPLPALWCSSLEPERFEHWLFDNYILGTLRPSPQIFGDVNMLFTGCGDDIFRLMSASFSYLWLNVLCHNHTPVERPVT